MLAFDPYDELSFADQDDDLYDDYLEDEVCPVCDAELDNPGHPCTYCDWDPLVGE